MKCTCGVEQTFRASSWEQILELEQEREIKHRLDLEKKGIKFGDNLDQN
jgi:hypothetical protein